MRRNQHVKFEFLQVFKPDQSCKNTFYSSHALDSIHFTFVRDLIGPLFPFYRMSSPSLSQLQKTRGTSSERVVESGDKRKRSQYDTNVISTTHLPIVNYNLQKGPNTCINQTSYFNQIFMLLENTDLPLSGTFLESLSLFAEEICSNLVNYTTPAADGLMKRQLTVIHSNIHTNGTLNNNDTNGTKKQNAGTKNFNYSLHTQFYAQKTTYLLVLKPSEHSGTIIDEGHPA
jgi:hypothetical protein